MSAPLPYAVARDIGNNLASGFRQTKDENAIEKILSDAMGTGDPAVLQNSIGRILSQVSPERQGVALQYLQNAYSNVQKKQEQAQQFKREEEAGLVPGINPTAQAAIYKEKAKSQRLAPYGLNGDPNAPLNQPTAAEGTSPYLSGVPNSQPTASTQGQESPQSVFKKFSDDQLVTLTGSPDKEVSEPAKAELNRRDADRKVNLKKNENWTKFGMERAKKGLDKAEEIAQTLPVKKTALKLMNDSLANKNLGFFSRDNLAEITGIEGFRSKEGAIFKTAGKEYFLGNISRAGARPNQWIEQQIADMMTKVGRDNAANLSVARALQNETDIDEERVRLTQDEFTKLREEDKDVGELGTLVNKKLAKFAEQKQNELFNDLRAIKAIDEKTPQKFHKVEQGTQISPYMVDALLNAFNNDPDRALQEAKKLGYTVE